MKRSAILIIFIILFSMHPLSASQPDLLFSVIENRNAEYLEKLLKEGHDPNVFNSAGETPLMKAKSNPDLCEILLKHGADINLENKDGKSFLIVLGENKYSNERTQILQLVLKHSKKKPDYNIQDGKGMTALMYAVSYEYTDDCLNFIKLLIDKMKDYNTADIKNKTALEHAIDYTSIITASYLIQKGGIVKVKTKENRNNAFLASALKGDLNGMKALLKSWLN